MESKVIIDNFDFETCPICGGWAEWVGSDVNKESYCDTYKCDKCGKEYTIVFEMNYKYHTIDAK